LTIIPLLALRNVYEIDAFLSQDRSAIFVSDDLITRINYNSRLRFTLAHELGHYFLHEYFYNDLTFNSAIEWKKYQDQFDKYPYYIMDQQAHNFAGVILVPDEHLNNELTNAQEMLENGAGSEKFDYDKIPFELLQEYISKHLSRKFEVSTAVISKRIEFEKLSYRPY